MKLRDLDLFKASSIARNCNRFQTLRLCRSFIFVSDLTDEAITVVQGNILHWLIHTEHKKLTSE